jgi:hypothetical protein
MVPGSLSAARLLVAAATVYALGLVFLAACRLRLRPVVGNVAL